jgi:hypothetical protein
MIIETIGPFKKEFLEGGKLSKRYFDKNCQLKRMKVWNQNILYILIFFYYRTNHLFKIQ